MMYELSATGKGSTVVLSGVFLDGDHLQAATAESPSAEPVAGRSAV